MFVMEELVWTDQESHWYYAPNSLLDLMYDQEIHLYHQIGLKEMRFKKNDYDIFSKRNLDEYHSSQLRLLLHEVVVVLLVNSIG